MTINNFIRAIAAKLVEMYPGKKVFVNQIPNSADGGYMIRNIDAAQQKQLGRRHHRTTNWEVLYFLRENDSMLFNDWADEMFGEFVQLRVVDGQATKLVWLTGQEAREGNDEKVYQFTFTADYYFEYVEDPGDPMEAYELTLFFKQGDDT